MRFRDIPQLTQTARYVVDTSWDYLESQLASYDERGELDLNPPFQRAHVWDEEKQHRYVEYILRGGKSSRDIYFNQAGWMRGYDGPMYLVDGKQRLEAVRKFLRGELAIFEGCRFSDYTDRLPLEAGFRFHVNNLATYPEVLQWYLDLNDGGVAHTQEELDKVRQMLAAETAKS